MATTRSTLGETLEALPDDVAASIETRDRWRAAAAASDSGLEFLVSHLQRWPVGATVRVAFLGGSTDLHERIASATESITDVCNLTFDFGRDEVSGTHRQWSESDTTHTAEIRVSFDQPGYFSLVGTDSNDPTISPPGAAVGGRANQRSLNLGGFDDQLPGDWEGTVLHEFMHAIAFQHEHQNQRGPCQEQFRWGDDPGYVPTTDAFGRYVVDGSARRPGIYTFLSGAPNFWPSWKVDHNLRADSEAPSAAGNFDADSVMLYRFPSLFYKTEPSDCAPTGDGQVLSDGDKDGLRLLYPSTAGEVESVTTGAEEALAILETGQESVGSVSAFERRATELLRGHTSGG